MDIWNVRDLPKTNISILKDLLVIVIVLSWACHLRGRKSSMTQPRRQVPSWSTALADDRWRVGPGTPCAQPSADFLPCLSPRHGRDCPLRHVLPPSPVCRSSHRRTRTRWASAGGSRGDYDTSPHRQWPLLAYLPPVNLGSHLEPLPHPHRHPVRLRMRSVRLRMRMLRPRARTKRRSALCRSWVACPQVRFDVMLSTYLGKQTWLIVSRARHPLHPSCEGLSINDVTLSWMIPCLNLLWPSHPLRFISVFV